MVSAVTKTLSQLVFCLQCLILQDSPILSQKTVDINMTPVTLKCTVIFQKYCVFWLGDQQGQQIVIDDIGKMSSHKDFMWGKKSIRPQIV